MVLSKIINKLKSLFIKPEPEVETPVLEVQPAEVKKPRKKAAKKVTK
jgi:hypothetical protein